MRSVAGERMLVMRDGVLPIVDGGARLRRVADARGRPRRDRAHGRRARSSLAVTQLVGQHELVTRPLPAEVAERAALTGGAVLPDGQIALIVDCDALGEGAPRVPAPALAA